MNRASRRDLWEPGGEIPPGYPTTPESGPAGRRRMAGSNAASLATVIPINARLHVRRDWSPEDPDRQERRGTDRTTRPQTVLWMALRLIRRFRPELI